MAEYFLKKSPVTPNRIRKHAKEMFLQAKADREEALKVFEWFKKIAEDETQPLELRTTSYEAMLEALKLSQSARSNNIKVIEYMVKLEGTSPTTSKEEKQKPATEFSFEDFNLQ